jgi:hypothetical protein
MAGSMDGTAVVREDAIPSELIDVFVVCWLRWMSLLFTVIRAVIRTQP